MQGDDRESLKGQFNRFAILLGLVITALAMLPSVIGWLSAPPGALYLGSQTNVDDHMVYAAWMRQAMNGQVFFDNRFTIDSQPGLTINLYFLVLGNLARFVGIPAAAALGRAVFGFLFVWLLSRLLLRLQLDLFTCKFALVVTSLGCGLGFLVWQNFGLAITGPSPEFLSSFLIGRLPNDVWQPEAFVFPSMLTNGLFMVSLCLIIGVFISLLDARDSTRAIVPGFVCCFVLMNIHSYDLLLVGLVSLGLLVASVAQRTFSWSWIVRSIAILAGSILPALWFLHVLRNDPVFQARAATETYSYGFRQLLLSLLPAIALGFFALRVSSQRSTRWLGAGALGAILLALTLGSSAFVEGYWMSPAIWAASAIGMLCAVWLLSGSNTSLNLVTAWALLGLIAPYFPALFQRKLSMGIAVPWLILAGIGFASLASRLERPKRNLFATLAILILAATSLRWLQREIMFVRSNVSNTTLHPVYLTLDAKNIVDILNRSSGRTVVLAPPGLASPTEDPDKFLTPYLPDLNPIVSGLTGAYTYAGHWSETPDYPAKRSKLLTDLFLTSASADRQRALLDETGADYVIAPNPSAFPEYKITRPDGQVVALADLSRLGEIVYDGAQFKLIRMTKP